MKIIKKLVLKEEEKGLFINALFEEYEKRQNYYSAIVWAVNRLYPKATFIQRNFPEVIIVGNEYYSLKDTNFIQEQYVGRLIMIQPGLIVYFPGEDLTDQEKKNYFCGIVFPAKYGEDNCLFTVFGVSNNAYCYITKKEEDSIFYWQYGEPYDGLGGCFQISDEVINKIKKLFATQM